MHRHHTISVVIPCYNEEHGIRQVIERMPRCVDEVVVVDNNCTDRTAAVARAMGARVVREDRAGYGAAYKAGLRAAATDLVVTMDGDGSYPPEEIPRLIDALLEAKLDLLSACRFPLTDQRAMELTNRLGNWVLTLATALLFARGIRDSQSGMWVFPRTTLARLSVTSDGMAFSEEIKIDALVKRLRFGEVHIPYGSRVGAVKLQKWRDGFSNLWFLVRKRFVGSSGLGEGEGALFTEPDAARTWDRAA